MTNEVTDEVPGLHVDLLPGGEVLRHHVMLFITLVVCLHASTMERKVDCLSAQAQGGRGWGGGGVGAQM